VATTNKLCFISDWTPCGVLLGCWRRGWCKKSVADATWRVWANHGLEWLSFTKGNHSWSHCYWLGPTSHSASHPCVNLKNLLIILHNVVQNNGETLLYMFHEPVLILSFPFPFWRTHLRFLFGKLYALFVSINYIMILCGYCCCIHSLYILHLNNLSTEILSTFSPAA